ncbi:MAG TPA: 50S ribosome-binding GTPase [bacterium]|nr:50S ribosome-binding GTPase [bacterium]
MHLAERLGTTIAALATAPGGAIAVIRISGPATGDLLRRITGRERFTPRQATICTLDLGSSVAPEQALALYFVAPASYTGEEMAELQIHGGGGTVEETLTRLHELGARSASPGEFSFRAVINGKLSLARAAALPDLIAAQDRLQADIARRAAYQGLFEQAATPLLAEWDRIDALANAVIDFPEQFSEEVPVEELGALLDRTRDLATKALDNTRRFHRAAPPRVLIAGRPNVGKSLLFNRLLGRERAIVSPEAGTTRDYLSADLHLPHPAVTLELYDSAGLRENTDGVEREGISRTLTLSEVSDQIILLFDGSVSPTDDDRAARVRFAAKEPIVVANKRDIGWHPHAARMEPSLCLSALTGDGIEELVRLLVARITPLLPDPSLPVLLHAERRFLAERLVVAAEELHAQIAGADPALLVGAIGRCRALFGELAGRSDDPDLYERIFSSFCLGK